MVDPRIEKLAKLCVQYSVEVKPKEKVIINGSELAMPLIHEIYKECLLQDAYPMIILQPDIQYTFFKYAKEHQLTFISPFERFLLENVDISIRVYCDPNPKRLTNIDPAKIRMHAAARKELTRIFSRRVAEGKLRWTVLPYPISAQAQEAGMSLTEYEDFVYSSCLVNRDDPIAEWIKIHKEQERVCKYLDSISELRIVGEDTDISMSVKGRKWINCDGKYNMPDGEVFTAPVENSVEGTIRFTFPGIVAGKEVEDVRLRFEKGRVVEASAAKGEDLLKELLKIEGASRVGEVAIGTNYAIDRFTKNMLFDEKMGGTIHIALGDSYPESGGKNRSAIHWDILKDMKKEGEIYADGKLIYRDGRFLI
ncbi:aminopeptidase [Candidatus Bathyarchaeota archaeon]|nr:aminopeptidase [Candidatus Bathyarchaeota archaeon]